MLQKGKEYYRIPFFVAGFIFFAEIVDRRVFLCEKSLWLATGWRITFVEPALYGEAKKSELLKCRKWSDVSFR